MGQSPFKRSPSHFQGQDGVYTINGDQGILGEVHGEEFCVLFDTVYQGIAAGVGEVAFGEI